MRILTILLLLFIVFSGGLLVGLMHDVETKVKVTEEKEDDDPIAQELLGLNELNQLEAHQSFSLEDSKEYPVEKVASSFEKVTKSFFEVVTNIIYSFVELFF